MNIECEIDPRGSKVFSEDRPREIISSCIAEVLEGCALNIADLPFYAAAMELSKLAIIADMDEDMVKVYNSLVDKAKVVTISPILRSGASD